MIDVVISGAAGRMGRAIGRAVWSTDDMRIVGALGAPDRPYTGEDLGTLLGMGARGVMIEEDVDTQLKIGRTWVEFSTPAATLSHAQRVAEAGLPMVIGTTGLTVSQKKELHTLAERMPCLLAPNTSVGANLLFTLVETVARTLGPAFDVEIIEAHHHFKKDAPSGTARHLAERVAHAFGQALTDVATYGRNDTSARRGAHEIGIHSIRAGDIVGEHTVLFGGMGERLELIHRVQSVDTFAYGAVQAIRFLQDRPPGLYTMHNVIEAMGDGFVKTTTL